MSGNHFWGTQSPLIPMKLETRVSTAKAVFFDLFHTLFSFKSDGTAGRSTSELLGIPEGVWDALLFDSSDERLRGRQTDKYEIIRKLAHCYDPSISEETIREAADLRAERFAQGLRSVKAERLEVLAELKRRGKLLGLISNADVVEVSGWRESPLYQYFDSVVFSFAVGSVKPEPEIYRVALESLGVSAEESVYVGDGGSDELRGAKELGFTTVMTTEIISKLWPEKIEPRRRWADYVVSSLRELTEVGGCCWGIVLTAKDAKGAKGEINHKKHKMNKG